MIPTGVDFCQMVEATGQSLADPYCHHDGE
jgi:hypothetical protein